MTNWEVTGIVSFVDVINLHHIAFYFFQRVSGYHWACMGMIRSNVAN